MSAIAHTGIAIANPVPAAVLDRFIGECALSKGDRFLDIGCGRGELIVRAVELTGCAAVGIDSSPRQIAVARAEAARRVPDADIVFHEAVAEAAPVEPRSYRLVSCVGSTHAYGGLAPALATLPTLLEPGGHVLIGDGYWSSPPTAEYLAGWGATADELPNLATFEALFPQNGLNVSDRYLVTLADWDAYEDPWLANLEGYAAAHPDDPDAAGMREWAGEARARRRLGPGVLGFALVLALLS